MSGAVITRMKGVKGRKMQPAVAFAHENGFEVIKSNGGHLLFRHGGRQVIAGSSTPRSERPARWAITAMRRHLREVEAAKLAG
jgi:predicted RNA binding protein YcfA (HicA-like mRNA interferase family)